MKIYIGPYAKSYSTSRMFDRYISKAHPDKHFWDVSEADYTKTDKFVEKISDGIDWLLNNTINRVSYRFTRKVKVKIHSYDTWNGDWTLAQVIYPWLVQYKLDNNHTEPADEEIDAMIFSFKEIAEERSAGEHFGLAAKLIFNSNQLKEVLMVFQ